MLGAIAGDIIGSPFEFNSIKDVDFHLFGRRSRYTDDSVMTMAVAEWLLDDPNHSHQVLEEKMVKFGNMDSDAGKSQCQKPSSPSWTARTMNHE